MKYKILLTGNNKTVIDDLFSKPSENFEYQSTSARYEDIICHMKYFQPDGFLYCLNHELPENFRKMPDLKQTPEALKTSFFALGTRGDCDAYTRTAPDIVSLVMEKPITISAMEEKMLAFFSSPSSDDAIPSDNMAGGSQSQNNAAAQAMDQPKAVPAPQTAGQVQGSSPAQASHPRQDGNLAQAGNPLSAANPLQTAGQTQSANGAQSEDMPQAVGQARSVEPPAGPKTAPEPAAPAASVDPNDELLSALTAQLGEAAKMLDSVADLNLEPEIAESPLTNRKHVLVVDDDSRMLKIINRHLAEKYDVATALNGRIALKFLENRTTDLILLDYEMPLENGPAVLKKLRDNPKTRNLPVIFLTGISDRNKIEKALALKPQGYLLKPIDHIKLLSTISKFID